MRTKFNLYRFFISVSLIFFTLAGNVFDMFPFSQAALQVEAADPVLQTTSGSSFDVFIDENNDICIITNDKIKAGSIYYRTIGFSISRGQFNPSAKKLANGASTEYFTRWVNQDLVTTYTVGNRQINIFRYPFEALKSQMSAAWQQEIQDAEERGMTAYIRFDAIMMVWKGNYPLTSHLYVNNPTVGPYDDENLDLNPRELQNAQSWSAGANTGIKTHYHRWLPISSNSAIIPDTSPLTDYHVTQNTTPGPGVGAGTSTLTYYGDYTGAPEYAGGNANLEGYSAALGVPSTKTITGYAESSPWFGNLDVWARLVSHQYEKTDTYKWEVVPLSTSYSGSPIKDTGSITSKMKNAVDAMDEGKESESARIEPLLAKEEGHDTEIEKIFHYYAKTQWTDDEGNILASTGGTDGNGCIIMGVKYPAVTINDHTYSGSGIYKIPTWWNGWEWTTFDGYEDKITGYDENNEPILGPDYDRPIYTPHTMTWTDYTDTKPAPTGSNIVRGPSKTYTNGSLILCEYMLSAVMERVFFDDHYNAQEDHYMQAYASFEYIDPYKTNFYDLNSVTLYNDIYGSMSFAQVVDTLMDSQKGSIKTESTIPFDTWLSQNEGAAQIGSDMIATSDYIKWAEIEDEERGRLELSYEDDEKEQKLYISENTKSINDYVYVKNPLDLGPDDGVYIGNSSEREYGIVEGCDFRDAEYIGGGYESLGAVDPLLSGKENVVTDDEIYDDENNMSKYWYLCIHTAGGDEEKANAYVSLNQGKLPGVIKVWEKLGYQTTPIDPETANGSHSTGISTLYVQEIIGPTTATSVMQYTDEVTNGHLYSNAFGTSGSPLGYSRWGSLMGSAEGGMDESGGLLAGPGSVPSIDGEETGDVSYIVDPVQIHTPIMSPGTIYNTTSQKTTRDSNAKTTVGSGSNAYEISTSATNLYEDVSAEDTSQLRLDQYYYIKWQDLSELSTQHRMSADTPEYGGYAHQTDNEDTGALEEDEFTKAKYFKFPFEVMYDGKYYKANQWIEVKNPNTHTADGEEGYDDYGYMREPNPTVNSASDGIPGELKSENHWVYTPFYIPSWATEGLFEEIDNDDPYDPQDLTTCAQLRVDAVNVSQTDAAGNTEYRADELQELANTYYNVSASTYDDGAAYVSQFNYPVQLSGWIYDFTITGISDIDNFGTLTWSVTDEEEKLGTQSREEYLSQKIENEYAYSFTAHKQDKKSGLRNRLGYPGIRYLKDGKLNTTWDYVNTIALVGAWEDTSGNSEKGKSNSWPSKGAVVKGTTFAFTLKTMSNMWNFNGKDKISITPSFTYHKYDLESASWIELENEDLKVYYDENDDNLYIPYGSDKDLDVINSASLGETQFDESYYTGEDTISARTFGDWIWYNTYMYDLKYGKIPVTMTLDGFKAQCESDPESILDMDALTPEYWLGEKIDEYCLSNITIPERMRLLSGEAEQLMFNTIYNGQEASSLTFVTPKTLVGSSYGKEYESHFLSDNSLVITESNPSIVINDAEEEITMDNKFRYSIQSWYGKYYVPQELYVVDLTKYPQFRDFSDKHSPYYDRYVANGGYVYGYELGDSGDNNKYWDYMEYYINKTYINGSSVEEDNEVFIQDGYLSVNFDIIAVKNGEPHLVYDGGNIGEIDDVGTTENENNNWTREGYEEVPDDLNPPKPGKTDEESPTDEGDVVVVDLGTKFKDRFKAAIFNIN